MIYGAYGYTGELIAEEALRRGHRPLLAGRSEAKLRPLAERLNLEWKAVDLGDAEGLRQAVAEVDLVYHAAGPFSYTSEPMVRACLEAKTNYVDVTGEFRVFEATLAEDARAKEAKVALISGVGFDVVPTDCLAKYVADAAPGSTELEIGFALLGETSRGTMKTTIEGLAGGNYARRNGVIVERPLGADIREVRFSEKTMLAASIPWGDIATAYRTTGIPNITVYIGLPRAVARLLGATGRWLPKVLSFDPLRKAALGLVDRVMTGPGEAARERGRSLAWARASGNGSAKEAWLSLAEGYIVTARAGVLSVERVLTNRPVGALTPAQAFGADFILEIEGTKRFDSLP